MNYVKHAFTALICFALSVQAAAQQTAPAPTHSPAVTNTGDVVQSMLALLVVLGALMAIVWFLKRMGLARTGGVGVARVVGGVSVGNRERVLVIEIADQWVVVGVGPGRVNALTTMPRKDVAAPTIEPLPMAKNFSGWLKQTIDKRNGKPDSAVK